MEQIYVDFIKALGFALGPVVAIAGLFVSWKLNENQKLITHLRDQVAALEMETGHWKQYETAIVEAVFDEVALPRHNTLSGTRIRGLREFVRNRYDDENILSNVGNRSTREREEQFQRNRERDEAE